MARLQESILNSARDQPHALDVGLQTAAVTVACGAVYTNVVVVTD